MPITVTMLQTRQGEGGVLWTAGNSYSASDAFGAYLISSNLATGSIPLPDATSLSPAAATAVLAMVSDGPIPARVFAAKGSRQQILVNGNTVDLFPTRTQFHDAMPENGSLIDPVSQRSNFSLLNVGQQLVPIPDAVSPPYWTDPGPLLYTVDGSGNGFMPASIPGQLEFITHTDGEKCIQFSSPPGTGVGAAGVDKRRVQLNSPQFGGRQRVAWDLSFLFPSGDDAPYDTASGYNYPILLWQTKLENSQPFWQVSFVTTADPNVYRLRISWLYSDQSGDVTTYRRQFNENAAGFNNSASSNTLVDVHVSRNQWYDLTLETFLDERDITTAGMGEGFMLATLNGQRVLQWSGPTMMARDIDGNPPTSATAPRWTLGIYRYEFFTGGVPAPLDELDLDRQFDPAPFMRRILVRRAKMLLLQDRQRETPLGLRITADRTLTQADNGRVIECGATVTITVPDSLPANFRCTVIPSGTTSIARGGTALLNGAATTLTRAAATNPVVEILSRVGTTTSFVVTGS